MKPDAWIKVSIDFDNLREASEFAREHYSNRKDVHVHSVIQSPTRIVYVVCRKLDENDPADLDLYLLHGQNPDGVGVMDWILFT